MSMSWISVLAPITVFSVMLSLGLLLGREQLAAALQRRMVLIALLFAVVVPVPMLAVAVVKIFGLKGAVAAGVILMAISPGAPVALRRAIEAGGPQEFAPVLHLTIVICAVLTIPMSVAILDWVFDADFVVSPLHIAKQVFFAQLLPMGIGAAIRAASPALAGRLEPLLSRFSNLLLVVLVLACLAVLGPSMIAIGWAPFVAGAGLTVAALALGAAFAGRDSPVRPAGAVATAMRNPGLALLIATLNHAPQATTATIFSYALGLAIVVTAFVQWQRRRTAGRAREAAAR